MQGGGGGAQGESSRGIVFRRLSVGRVLAEVDAELRRLRGEHAAALADKDEELAARAGVLAEKDEQLQAARALIDAASVAQRSDLELRATNLPLN